MDHDALHNSQKTYFILCHSLKYMEQPLKLYDSLKIYIFNGK